MSDISEKIKVILKFKEFLEKVKEEVGRKV